MLETIQRQLQTVTDIVTGKGKKGRRRSSRWRSVRRAHLKRHPRCAVCEGNKKIEVHHKVPFHVRPDLELVPSNLMTLCERKKYGINCHQLIGHLGNYRRRNDEVEADARTWNGKLRPQKRKTAKTVLHSAHDGTTGLNRRE